MRAQGFSYEFDPSFCESCGGKCCTGESGYIWIDEGEILKFCAAFDMPKDEFESKFLIKVGVRRSIKEKPYDDGFACIFFDEKSRFARGGSFSMESLNLSVLPSEFIAGILPHDREINKIYMRGVY